MKCYFHNEVDAVSICRECNKNLCKTCYDRGNNGVCSDCLGQYKIKKRDEHLKKNKYDNYGYIKKSITYALVGCVVGLLFAKWLSSGTMDPGNFLDSNRFALYIFLPIVYAYSFFALHSGLHILSKILTSILGWGVGLIVGWPVLLILLVIAVFIGAYSCIPMFIYKFMKYKKGKKMDIT